MFVRMQNVAPVAIYEVGDGGDFAFLVRARDEQDGGGFHEVMWRVTPARGISDRASKRKNARSPQTKYVSYFFSSFNISLAAFAPDPPVSPAPGCVPLPHKYKFSIGVLYRAQSSRGRMVKNWSSARSPWKICPPVRPYFSSRSCGVMIWCVRINSGRFGAYCASVCTTVCPSALRCCSQSPLSLYGAYCM